MSRRRSSVAALAVLVWIGGCLNSPAPVSEGEDDESSIRYRTVYGLSVSDGRELLAIHGNRKVIELEHLPSRKAAGRLCYRRLNVQCAVFHPAESALLACYVDGSIVRWTQGATGWQSRLISRLRNGTICCAISRSGQQFAVGTIGGDVTVWTWEPQPRIVKRLRHPQAVWRLRYSPDGSELAVSGPRAMLKLWNVETWSAVNAVTGHHDVISGLCYSDDGERLVTGGFDGTLRIWDRSSGRTLWSVRTSNHGVRTVAFSPDGRVLAIGTVNSGTVQLRDAGTGRLLRRIPAHQSTVSHVEFLNDRSLLTGSHDGTVETIDVNLDR